MSQPSLSSPAFAPERPDKPDRMSARAWGVLLVLCGTIFMEGVDVAMLNVALPSIRADLDLSTGALQWVMSAYVLGYSGFVLLGGRAADMFGRRRIFLFWLVVFLAFSGLGGFATEEWMLLTARFVTGVAAAFMAPAGLSIITSTIPEGPQRNKALLVYAGTAAGGFSFGLVAGGLLTTIDWRWVFFAPVVLSAALLSAAVPLIPRSSRPDRTGQSLDLAGAFAITATLMLGVLAVERATHTSGARTAVTAAAALACLAAFVVIERRSSAPLVRLGVLRSADLLRANSAFALFAAAFFGWQFIAVLYLQELRGWSSLKTSLALLVVGLDSILAPTVTPRLVNRFGNNRVIFGGLLLAVLAYALFLPIEADWVYLAMLPTLVIISMGFALVYGPLTIAGTDGISEDEQGLAGGLLYTSFQFGGALGLSTVTAVYVAVAGSDPTGTQMLDGYRAALIVPVTAAVLAAAVMAFGLRRRTGAADPAAPSAADALDATVAGIGAGTGEANTGRTGELVAPRSG